MSARDSGAAAVELALLAPVLLGVLTLVVPLALMFHTQSVLGDVAGATARVATSRTEQPRTVGGELVPRGSLPAPAAAAAEGQTQADARVHGLPDGTTVAATVVRTPVPASTCPTTWSRTVRLTAQVPLGPAALLLGGPHTKTLTASATSCEE